MTLLKTNAVVVGAVLAFTGADPEAGSTFLHGSASEFNLERGDVIKIIDIDGSRPFAKVTVACLKGKFCGRIGAVTMDLSTRTQRSWQVLTQTGSMVAVRARPKARKPQPYSMVVGKSDIEEAPTTPAPSTRKSKVA